MFTVSSPIIITWVQTFCHAVYLVFIFLILFTYFWPHTGSIPNVKPAQLGLCPEKQFLWCSLTETYSQLEKRGRRLVNVFHCKSSSSFRQKLQTSPLTSLLQSLFSFWTRMSCLSGSVSLISISLHLTSSALMCAAGKLHYEETQREGVCIMSVW